MIEGDYWTGGDLRITLETGLNQTSNSGWVRAAFPNGPTMEYAWTVKHFSKVQCLIPAADNIYPGELKLQAFSVISGETVPGSVETAYIKGSLEVTP